MTKVDKSTVKDVYTRFLGRHGLEVIGDWDCEYADFGLVAKDADDGSYHFTCCFFPADEFEDVEKLPEMPDARQKCEKSMLAWAFSNSIKFSEDAAIYFDAIRIVVFPSGDRAILRHHKSIFSEVG